MRLTLLADTGALTDEEGTLFGEALWSRLDSSEPPWPADLTLYPHVIARLAAPEGYAPVAAARARLFDAPLKQNDVERLTAIVEAGCDNDIGQRLFPDPVQAARLFDEITAIEADENKPDTPAAIFGQARREAYERSATRALGQSVVPGLRQEDLSIDRFNSLKSLAVRLPAGNILAALPYFIDLGEPITTDVSSQLRSALAGPNSEDIHGAVLAIVRWAQLARLMRSPPLPDSLIHRVVGAVETRAGRLLNAYLWCARRLVELERMDRPSRDRLHEALGLLLDTLDYGRTAAACGEEAVTISLARAECVRLAMALTNAGESSPASISWLELAPGDPLPEVRYATQLSTFV